MLSPFTGEEQLLIENAIDQGILRLTKHIGDRIGVSPARVLHKQTEEIDSDKIRKGVDEKG